MVIPSFPHMPENPTFFLLFPGNHKKMKIYLDILLGYAWIYEYVYIFSFDTNKGQGQDV